MADPGYHSKFVEMQQDDYFERPIRRDRPTGDEGRRLDIARAEDALRNTRNPHRRQALLAALAGMKKRQEI